MMVQNPVNVELTDDAGQNSDRAHPLRAPRRQAAWPPSPIFLKDVAQAEKGEPSDKTLASLAAPAGKTRRQLMADFVIRHDNFAKAYVNRVWGHLFGRGLNKEPTVDDFGSHNEVVHPELLNYLAEEFAKYNYDPKMLLEWICTQRRLLAQPRRPQGVRRPEVRPVLRPDAAQGHVPGGPVRVAAGRHQGRAARATTRTCKKLTERLDAASSSATSATTRGTS